MSTVIARPVLDRGAFNVLLLVALSALVVLVFRESFAGLVEMWEYSSYNHCYLMPLISLFILFRDRDRLEPLAWRGSLAGLAALAGAVLLWLVGRGAAIQAFEHVALMSMVVAFLWAVAGSRLLTAAWFPLLYVFLAIPVGDDLVPYLQRVTADVSTAALNLFGVPAYREGYFISLPGGDFEVAKACSGFRYLNAGVAMALLISYLVLSGVWIRIAYVAFVAALFVFVNGVRAFLVMWIASATGMRYMVDDDHVMFGYVLFLGVAALSYWVATRISARDAEVGA